MRRNDFVCVHVVPENIHTPTKEEIGNSGACFTTLLKAFFRCYDCLKTLAVTCAMRRAKCLECLLLFYTLAKTIFSRGYWGVHNSSGNYMYLHASGKKWKFWLTWISLWGGGMDIFWNYMYTNKIVPSHLYKTKPNQYAEAQVKR